MKGIYFSVILPCYNLEKTIYQNIQRIAAYLEKTGSTFEIITVNDGSIDGTLEELLRAERDLGIQVVTYEKNHGKGYAVRQGVSLAHGEITGFLDADLAIPAEELGKFITSIQKGNNLAIASRLHPDVQVKIPVLWYRLFMERIFRYLRIFIIGGSQVKDTQCGCKVFDSRIKDAIFPYMKIDRFAFDAELIYLALKKNYRIEEIPITLQNPATSSIRIVEDSLIMLRDLFRVKWYSLTGQYRKKF